MTWKYQIVRDRDDSSVFNVRYQPVCFPFQWLPFLWFYTARGRDGTPQRWDTAEQALAWLKERKREKERQTLVRDIEKVLYTEIF